MMYNVFMRLKNHLLIFALFVAAVAPAIFFFYSEMKNQEKNTAVVETVDHKEASKTIVQEEVMEAPASTTMVVVGDMMFDRLVNHTFKSEGMTSVFANLDKSFFENKNIVLGNLEGPVSDVPIDDDYTPRTMVFNMPLSTMDALRSININAISLANNHTMNAGQAGFNTTQSILEKNNIRYAGHSFSFEYEDVIRLETAIPVSIIPVNFLSIKSTDKIVEVTAKEKAANRFVIVYPHWGEEYALKHDTNQEQLAKTLIDAGADMVLGNHPHVIQDFGFYKSKPIFYSLGNFVFDQTFSEETQEGLTLSMEIKEESLSITIQSVSLKNLTPKFETEETLNMLLNRISPTNTDPNITIKKNQITISR